MRPLPRPIPAKCTRADTMDTWPWHLQRQPLSIARFVSSRGAIKRNVLFVFQPAEETTGGAKTVCESGVFERYGVDRIFGFHVWPDLPAGTLASCSGPLLARSSETHIHIHGTSIHIAKTYGVPVGSRTMPRWRQQSFWLPSAS